MRLADLKAIAVVNKNDRSVLKVPYTKTFTGDQTSKCSEKQYKYEVKMCGMATLELGI